MKIFVDIDGVFCEESKDYRKAKPIYKNIEKINRLYDKGNRIVLWTARGTVTGKDWSTLTTKQLRQWRVKYHELRFGKPYFDLFIDNRAINIKDLKVGKYGNNTSRRSP